MSKSNIISDFIRYYAEGAYFVRISWIKSSNGEKTVSKTSFTPTPEQAQMIVTSKFQELAYSLI